MLFHLHSADSSYVDIIKLCSCIANQGILLGEWKPVAKDNVCVIPHSSEVVGKWISVHPDMSKVCIASTIPIVTK